MKIKNLVSVDFSKGNWFLLFLYFAPSFLVMETFLVFYWFIMKISRRYSNNWISLPLLCFVQTAACKLKVWLDILSRTWDKVQGLLNPSWTLCLRCLALSPAAVRLLCRITPKHWRGCGYVLNSFPSRNLCSYIWERMFLHSQSTICFGLPLYKLENISRITYCYINIFLAWLIHSPLHTL